MYVMTLNFPSLPKGAEVDIDGLGRFANGYEYEVSDEEAEAYRNHNTTQSHEWDEDGNMTTTTKKGATLLQAFKSNEFVTVKTDKDEEVDD